MNRRYLHIGTLHLWWEPKVEASQWTNGLVDNFASNSAGTRNPMIQMQIFDRGDEELGIVSHSRQLIYDSLPNRPRSEIWHIQQCSACLSRLYTCNDLSPLVISQFYGTARLRHVEVLSCGLPDFELSILLLDFLLGWGGAALKSASVQILVSWTMTSVWIQMIRDVCGLSVYVKTK